MQIKIFKSPLPYAETHDKMEKLVADIVSGTEGEQIWFLEHEPVYTAGTSAKPEDILTDEFPVVTVGRGGKHTYHGPGQRVIYLMLELKKHYPTPDIKKFVSDLENWVINSLAELGIEAFRREGRVGIWVKDIIQPPSFRSLSPESSFTSPAKQSDWIPDIKSGMTTDADSESKIAAIGIRVRRGVSFHGISININPNLAHFDGIVPCGIAEFGVTSLHALGHNITMNKFDEILIKNCPFLKK